MKNSSSSTTLHLLSSIMCCVKPIPKNSSGVSPSNSKYKIFLRKLLHFYQISVRKSLQTRQFFLEGFDSFCIKILQMNLGYF